MLHAIMRCQTGQSASLVSFVDTLTNINGIKLLLALVTYCNESLLPSIPTNGKIFIDNVEKNPTDPITDNDYKTVVG